MRHGHPTTEPEPQHKPNRFLLDVCYGRYAMACFSLSWVEQFLIGFVIVCVLIGIVKAVVPAVLSWFGSPPGGQAVITVLNFIAWGVVAIFAIVLFFDLLSCVVNGTSLRLR